MVTETSGRGAPAWSVTTPERPEVEDATSAVDCARTAPFMQKKIITDAKITERSVTGILLIFPWG
jgi:hypothetical protein